MTSFRKDLTGETSEREDSKDIYLGSLLGRNGRSSHLEIIKSAGTYKTVLLRKIRLAFWNYLKFCNHRYNGPVAAMQRTHCTMENPGGNSVMR
jgi:hypothetical protein